MVTAEPEASWCGATVNTGDGYLRRAGAAGPDPGGELVVDDLAAVQSAVDQAQRHRVLLAREPAGVTEALRARQGVSCTTRERPHGVDTWTNAIPPREPCYCSNAVPNWDNFGLFIYYIR